VRFAGHRRDIPRLLAAADVVCHPNEAPESFGLSFVEGLAASRPVIATRMGGAVEVIDDSCGVLVEPIVPAVASALEGLLRDPARCAELGAHGPARATELCDPRNNLSNLLALLRSEVSR
jgi:glycosyltransferase involved in cell wall biosynthesis